jgi:hypothetical protein
MSTRVTQPEATPEPASPDGVAPAETGVSRRADADDLAARSVAASLSWSPLAFGISIAFTAVVVCDSIAARPGEPGWLRWLRVFADHPIRGTVASSLLFFALSPQSGRQAVTPSRTRGRRESSAPD